MWKYPDEVNKVVAKEKIEEVAQNAILAMGSTIDAAFPEVPTGDYPPDVTMELEQDIINALGWWLWYNHPKIKD